MPHGLDVDRAISLLRDRREVWVQRLKEREGVSQKPMKMVGLSGINAIVTDPRGGRSRFRVPLAKLETASAPHAFVRKPEAALVAKVVDSIAGNAPAETAPPIAPPATPPPPANPREIAMSNATAPRVIYDQASRRFLTKSKKWVPDLDDARRYDSGRGINVAMGLLTGARGRAKGRDLVAITVAQAKAEMERLARPKPAEPEQVAPPAPAPAPAGAGVHVNGMAPAQPVAAPEASRVAAAEVASSFERLARAMRNEASAEAMVLAAKGERLQAEAELRIARMRIDLAL